MKVLRLILLVLLLINLSVITDAQVNGTERRDRKDLVLQVTGPPTPPTASSVVFTGTGITDLVAGGTYTPVIINTYTVIIDGTGTPDTFKWQKNAGGFTTLVAITGSAQALTDGVTVKFAATTGHTLTDQWVVTELPIYSTYFDSSGNMSVKRTDGSVVMAMMGSSAVTPKSFVYGDASGLLASTPNPTNGQLLIGSTSAIPVVAALTGTANQVVITNGAGSITFSLPQSIHTGASPTFTGLTLSGSIASSFLYSGAAGLLSTTAAPTNGQLLIAATGLDPVAATLTAGTNIAITNGAGSITLALTGVVTGTNGGTGVNNGASTITLAGNLATSGANPLTFTTTGSTNVTLPTSGTLLASGGAASFTNIALTNNTNQIALGATNIGTISMAALSGNRSWTFPDVTGNVITSGDTGTVTNTMLAGSIANSKLSNSSITVNGTANQISTTSASISLGGSATLSLASALQTASYEANGTAGAGYLQLDGQSSAPGTPTNALRLYADSNNSYRLTWIGTNGYTRSFDGSANTASRVYTLPDVTGTFATSGNLSSNLQFTGANLDTIQGIQTSSSPQFAKIGLGEAPTQIIDAFNGTALFNRSTMSFTTEAAPGAPTVAIAAGGSVDTGNHYYKVEFVTAVGQTSPGTLSAIATTTGGNNTVNLTSIPTGTANVVTARKIYRTKAGADQTNNSNFFLVTTLNDNSTTTYTDTTADAGISGRDIFGNQTAGLPNNTPILGTLNFVSGLSGTTYTGISVDGLAAITLTPGSANLTIPGSTSFTGNTTIANSRGLLAAGSGNNLRISNNGQGVDIELYPDASNGILVKNGGNVQFSKLVSSYNGVATTGWGHPAIYGSGRSTAQTGAVASIATYTVGAADGSFVISSNVNVTTSTTHSINVQVTYTDETNTSQTVTLNFQNLGGTMLTAITNVQGTGPYEGIPIHIRAKASTSITVKTTGTFTSVTYNVEGYIQQIG